MNDPLKPSLPLLVKLGSLIIHLEEASSPNGHQYDWLAAKQLQDDPELQEWFTQMKTFLPVKR